MKRARVLSVVVLVVVFIAGCAPKPPNEATHLSPVPDRIPFGNLQIFGTTFDEVGIYRASVTSLVLGPVELCLHVLDSSDAGISAQCETINAVPGTHYSVTYTVEKPTDPRAGVLMLASPTAAPAFVGTLSVIQGPPMRQR